MIYNKISVLIPTRLRLHRLLTLLQSYSDTTQGCADQSELVFRVDADDHASADFLRYRNLKCVVGPRYQGYDSMPLFVNELLPAADGDVLMIGNDDMVFVSKGWAPKILAEADKYPDGLFDIGVNTLNVDHYPFATVSRKVANKLGFIWDPRLHWGDIFLRDVMNHFGRCTILTDVQIDHDWAGFSPDQVFKESNKDIVSVDPTYWSEKHPKVVSEAIQKLQEVAG